MIVEEHYLNMKMVFQKLQPGGRPLEIFYKNLNLMKTWFASFSLYKDFSCKNLLWR